MGLLAFILSLAKVSVLLLIVLIAVPLVLVLWLLAAIGRWTGAGGRPGQRQGDALDLVQCPSCGDWVEGACGKPGCSAP